VSGTPRRRNFPRSGEVALARVNLKHSTFNIERRTLNEKAVAERRWKLAGDIVPG